MVLTRILRNIVPESYSLGSNVRYRGIPKRLQTGSRGREGAQGRGVRGLL